MDIIKQIYVNRQVDGFCVEITPELITYNIRGLQVKFTYKLIEDKIKLDLADEQASRFGLHIGTHCIRVLKTKNKVLEFDLGTIADIFEFLVAQLTNPYKTCTMCGKPTDNNKEIINSCEDNTCTNEYTHTVTDDIISMGIKKDPMVVYFLVLLATHAINDPRVDKIFVPRPSIYSDVKSSKFNELKKLISSKKILEQIKTIGETMGNGNSKLTDTYLFDTLGSQLYGLVKFVCLSNKTDISTAKLDEGMFPDEKLSISTNELLCFQVTHPDQVEIDWAEKSGGRPTHAFHGSGIGNFHSIMRNGLKNYSGTDMMTTGAVYGSGIYLGVEPQTSLGYCRGSNGSDIPYILAVVQVLESEQYNKGGFLVVPNESHVLIKYLLCVPGNRAASDKIGKISTYFKTRAEEIAGSVNNAAKIYAKRISNEMKKQIKNNNMDTYNVSADPDEIGTFLCTINGTNYKIMCGLKYPSSPPRIFDRTNGNIELFYREFSSMEWSIKKDLDYIIKTLEKKLNKLLY